MLLQTNRMAFREISDFKWPLTLGRFVEFPWVSPSGIPQTSLGLLGHLITNLPQAMLLLINESKDTVIESDDFPLRRSPLLFDNNL